MGVALCTRTDLYPRVDLYLHTSEKMIGGAYLFSLVFMRLDTMLLLQLQQLQLKFFWLNALGIWAITGTITFYLYNSYFF